MSNGTTCRSINTTTTYLHNTTDFVKTGHILVTAVDGHHKGFPTNTLAFDACGSAGINPIASVDEGNDVSVTVVRITTSDSSISLWLSNCDESSTLKVTEPGVYVIQGTLMSVIAERHHGCSSPSMIAFQKSSLAD